MTEAGGHSYADLVQRVRDEWGDQLVPVRPEHVHPLVEQRTREFLTAVGLPDAEIRDIVPIRDERLLDLFEREGRCYVVISTDLHYRYAIEVATGAVWFLHDEPDYETPTNSSIAAFVLAIGLLKHELADLEVGTRETVTGAVDSIWAQLDEWDPDGLEDDDSQWNVLLNQYALEYD